MTQPDVKTSKAYDEMTEQEVAEQVARRISSIAGVAFDTLPIPYQDRNIRSAREIMQLIKQAGYRRP